MNEISIKIASSKELLAQNLLDSGKIKEASEEYSQALEILNDEEKTSGISPESEEWNAFFMLKTRVLLGQAECCYADIPEFVWDERECLNNSETNNSLIELETDYCNILESCEKCASDTNEDIMLIKAMALYGLAQTRERIFEYEYSCQGECDYFGYNRHWPYDEYEFATQAARKLVEINPTKYERLLIKVLKSKADWQSSNCDISNNRELFGCGEYDSEDCRARIKDAIAIYDEILSICKKHPEENTEPIVKEIEALKSQK